jgi:hypothetical protein
MDFSYADPAVATFIVIPLLLGVALVWGSAVAWQRSGAPDAVVRRVSRVTGVLVAGWMTATWTIARAGGFRHWDRTPPPFGLLIVAVVLVALACAFSPFGRRLARGLPLWTLVAVHVFRLPLELAMHTMYERGIMPREMSYAGHNFDVATGIAAIFVAGLVVTGYGGRRLVAVWNVAGLALLLNVVVIAILGTPRFQYFGTERLNVWVTSPPFVWLPAVMVLAALMGHLVIFRALSQSPPRTPEF